MCQADTTLVTFSWDDSIGDTVGNFTTPHKCVRWDGLMEWVNPRTHPKYGTPIVGGIYVLFANSFWWQAPQTITTVASLWTRMSIMMEAASDCCVVRAALKAGVGKNKPTKPSVALRKQQLDVIYLPRYLLCTRVPSQNFPLQTRPPASQLFINNNTIVAAS